MEANNHLITRFYTAFANQDATGMASCYHSEIQFEDPVFGPLQGNQVMAMWTMLLKRSKGLLHIDYSQVKASATNGSCVWVATYPFSQTNRKVVNIIQATFEFKDGLIYRHRDHFNLWNWSRQALGFKGLLLGWTPFMQKQIQRKARLSLAHYAEKSN